MAEWMWQRLVQGCQRLWEHEEWGAVLPADWVRTHHDRRCDRSLPRQQGRSTGRWIVENQHGRVAVYLKRNYRLSWWQGLLATIWPGGGWSPAEQERRRLAWAARHGLHVPRDGGARNSLGLAAVCKACWLVEELAGMLPVNEAIPLAAQKNPPVTSRSGNAAWPQNWRA